MEYFNLNYKAPKNRVKLYKKNVKWKGQIFRNEYESNNFGNLMILISLIILILNMLFIGKKEFLMNMGKKVIFNFYLYFNLDIIRIIIFLLII